MLLDLFPQETPASTAPPATPTSFGGGLFGTAHAYIERPVTPRPIKRKRKTEIPVTVAATAPVLADIAPDLESELDAFLRDVLVVLYA